MLVSAEAQLRHHWYPVAHADDVTVAPVGRTLLGTDLVLWRDDDGDVVAADDRCPHREARLSEGWTDGGEVVCPYHGWQFGSDGACTLIPQNAPGQRPNPRARVTTYPTAISMGLVWTTLSRTPVGAPPIVPAYEDPAWRVVREFDAEWPCSAPHLLDNNLDYAHPAYVHAGTFGDPKAPLVVVGPVERTPYGLLGTARIPVNGRPGEDGGLTERLAAAHVVAPFTGLFHITYPDGVQHVLVKAITPIDDRRCRLMQISLRNDTEEDRPGDDIRAFDAAVAAEDRVILVTMPEDFPLSAADLVHIHTDRLSLAYRALLAEVCDGRWVPGPPTVVLAVPELAAAGAQG